jgi:protein farnesyltransferase/geranylgeranyltransferase type-1 subunit alpha
MVLFRDRPDWADVAPIKQDDGPFPLVVIQYTESFVDCHDYFRAILQARETSERALNLTAVVIDHNSANYTAWYHRRLCLKALNADLHAELEFTETWMNDSPKNYQVWYHRRWLIQEIGDAGNELSVVAEAIDRDSKNYNAWSHRQWVVNKFNQFDGELDYTKRLIGEDVRNNSAWNHRHYVLVHHGITPEVAKREVAYALEVLKCAPHNEAPWNYIRAFIGTTTAAAQSALAKSKCLRWSDVPAVEQFADASGPQNRFALEVKSLILLEKGDVAAAKLVYGQLEVLDTVRARYWAWRAEQLTAT